MLWDTYNAGDGRSNETEKTTSLTLNEDQAKEHNKW